MVDEAQSIPYELLEEIRLLSNIETTTTKLVNVILAGQPELSDRLNDTSLRQLKQRISLRCQLTPMDLNETASYHRRSHPYRRWSTRAGVHARGRRCDFRGFGRVTAHRQRCSDNALIGGFAARVKPINAAFVEEVCRDFDIRRTASSPGEVPAFTEQDEPPAAGENRPLGAPRVPAAASGAAPALESDVTPIFGHASRKRRFSFF